MLDCELLREVYINLLDAKEPKLMFFNENLKTNEKKKKSVNKNYCKIIVNPTTEEIKSHATFLKKELKKNFY